MVFLLTLIFVIWQPKARYWLERSGAAVALAAGVIHLSDIPVVWHDRLERHGTLHRHHYHQPATGQGRLLRVGSLHAAWWGGGRGRMLFVLLVLLAQPYSALFANDGAALILTPIVIAMRCWRCDSRPRRRWPLSWRPASSPIQPVCHWCIQPSEYCLGGLLQDRLCGICLGHDPVDIVRRGDAHRPPILARISPQTMT
jgi:hypothetical protein